MGMKNLADEVEARREKALAVGGADAIASSPTTSPSWWAIPASPRTDKRCVAAGGAERCKVAIQTNNVEVDDRGYISIVDRADTGMQILELTGSARAIVNFPAQTK